MTEVSPGVFRLEKIVPSGWSINMLLVRLKDGGLLVHSPTWLGSDTFDKIDAIGKPSVLLAPNHFHHMSLARFRERYPEAKAVAGEGAMRRLVGKGHAGLADVREIEELLPDGAKVLPTEATKTGEVWLSLPGDGGRTLVVCDGFFNCTRPVTGVMGFVSRALRVIPNLQISRTYTLLGVRDAAAHRKWAIDTLEAERPTRLLVSHGEAVESEDLTSTLVGLVRAHI